MKTGFSYVPYDVHTTFTLEEVLESHTISKCANETDFALASYLERREEVPPSVEAKESLDLPSVN